MQLPANHKPTQAHFIRQYNDSHREQFNDTLFVRSNQEIIDDVSKVIMSCERDKYFTLKVLSLRAIMDYEEIYNSLRDHVERNRKKSDRKENFYDYINLRDSDIMLLEIKYLVRHNGIEKQKIDGKLTDVKDPQQILTVLMALPRFVRKYYFRLNGTYYSAATQIVDGSTYNNSTSLNSKSDFVTKKTMFQPAAIFRMFRDIVDVNSGEVIKNIIYTSIVFNNHLDAMYYILAAYGVYPTFDFLGIHCVEISKEPNNNPGMFCFKKHNLYVSYPKCMTDPMVQSLAVTIYDAIQKDTTLEMVYNIHFWLMNLGRMYKNESIDKGLFVLDSLESIYDQIEHEELRVPESEKRTIYHVFRWLMREFNPLRARDNTDVSFKKRRISKYIAAIVAVKLFSGICRMADMGKRVTLNSVIRAVNMDPMYVIQKLLKQSNLIEYQDMVNDGDATIALKWTYKGIQGLGEDGSSVQPIYRHIDPSYIGILDLNNSPTSDPGMSGMLCPMTSVSNNGYFTDYQEPNTWYDRYQKEQDDYMFGRKNVTCPIHISVEETFEKSERREQVIKDSLELTKRRCPIYNLWNPSITYTDEEEQAIEETKIPPLSNLFSIFKEDEE